MGRGRPAAPTTLQRGWTAGELCSFVLEAVGAGTRLLVGLRPGDPLQALGPRQRFPPRSRTRPRRDRERGWAAPLPLLVRELRRRGCADVIVLSGRRHRQPSSIPRRASGGAKDRSGWSRRTDDGSRGGGRPGHRAGRRRLRRDGRRLCCGPNPMLAAWPGHSSGWPSPRRAHVSLEARWVAASAPAWGAPSRIGRRNGSSAASGAGEGGLRGGLARAARPASGARRMTAATCVSTSGAD